MKGEKRDRQTAKQSCQPLGKLKIRKRESNQIKSTLLVHPIKMGFHIPITIKSNMKNRNSI